MQQMEAMTEMGGAKRKRVEVVVETLAMVGNRGETVAEVAHDARNMVTALGLYCDLLEEPGVLANPFAHYGSELRLVATASRRLVEKLVALDASRNAKIAANASAAGKHPPSLGDGNRLPDDGREAKRLAGSKRWDLMPAAPIANLAEELLANHNLLGALAGPSIALTVDVEGSARPVRMTGEDLTRVLVNLVKNAAEAMPSGGRIQIGLREIPARAGAAEALLLTVEDNGPGIPEQALESIFMSGYTTRAMSAAGPGSWTGAHRGLGLPIARSLVEAAGGRILAVSRRQDGARFEIELPVRKAGL